MKKFHLTKTIQEKQYEPITFGVELEFPDDKPVSECWQEVDKALDYKKDLIQSGVELDREFAREIKPATSAITTPSAEFSTVKMCPIHNVALEVRYSKTKKDEKGNPKKYEAHGQGPDICFGKPMTKEY